MIHTLDGGFQLERCPDGSIAARNPGKDWRILPKDLLFESLFNKMEELHGYIEDLEAENKDLKREFYSR